MYRVGNGDIKFKLEKNYIDRPGGPSYITSSFARSHASLLSIFFFPTPLACSVPREILVDND